MGDISDNPFLFNLLWIFFDEDRSHYSISTLKSSGDLFFLIVHKLRGKSSGLQGVTGGFFVLFCFSNWDEEATPRKRLLLNSPAPG